MGSFHAHAELGLLCSWPSWGACWWAKAKHLSHFDQTPHGGISLQGLPSQAVFAHWESMFFWHVHFLLRRGTPFVMLCRPMLWPSGLNRQQFYRKQSCLDPT